MKEEEKRQNELRDDRITVHVGEFRIEKMTEDTHSLTSEEYKQKKLKQLEEMREILKKKKETQSRRIK